MTYVVQDACVKCKYGDCVEVCPVNCFYEGEDMLYINPDECIDCSACVPACPVEAIVADDEAEDKWVTANAEFDFQEDSRREDKDDIAHGPNWDESKA